METISEKDDGNPQGVGKAAMNRTPSQLSWLDLTSSSSRLPSSAQSEASVDDLPDLMDRIEETNHVEYGVARGLQGERGNFSNIVRRSCRQLRKWDSSTRVPLP